MTSTPGGATERLNLTEHVALATMNSARQYHGLDPIKWDCPAISSWHRANSIRLAGDVIAAINEFVSAVPSPDSKLEAYRKALEFYADENRYSGSNIRLVGDDAYTPEGQPYMQDVTRDCGEIARKALAAGG